MAGLCDGVSTLWILRTDGGALDIQGCKNEVDAIDALIRRMLAYSKPETETAVRAQIEETVREALRHLDEPEADEQDENDDG